MSRNTKRTLLLLFAVSLVSLVVLAASLPNLQLHSGTPFPGSNASSDDLQSAIPISPARVYSIPLLRGALALVFLIVMFYIPTRLITRVNLKIILQLMLALVVLLILVYMLPDMTPAQSTYVPNTSSEIATVPSFDYPVTPLGQPPQILIWFVIAGVVLGLGWLIFIVLKRRMNSAKIEVELLQQAEDAVDALRAGMDLRNVIVRCYLQMTYAIQEEQGIERSDTMTAREFENWLEQKGFPTDPVRQLTFLFEKVRYSPQQTSYGDEKIATDSLNEIILFCRSGRVSIDGQ